MSGGLELNLQLIQSMVGNAAVSGNNSTAQKAEKLVYAKEGDPLYDEAMDADKDGVVTMEEYEEYRKENGGGTEEAVQNAQGMADSLIKKNEMAYDDYMNYAKTESASIAEPSTKVEMQKTAEAGLMMRSVGKALTNYSNSGIKVPEAKIERSI